MPISMQIDTLQPAIWHFDTLGQSQDIPATGDFLSHMSPPDMSKVDGVTDAKAEEAETPQAETYVGQDIGALIGHDLPAVPPPVMKDPQLEGTESAPPAPVPRQTLLLPPIWAATSHTPIVEPAIVVGQMPGHQADRTSAPMDAFVAGNAQKTEPKLAENSSQRILPVEQKAPQLQPAIDAKTWPESSIDDIVLAQLNLVAPSHAHQSSRKQTSGVEPSGGPKTDDIEPLGPAADLPKNGQGRLLATDPDIAPTRPTKPPKPNASDAEDRPDMPTIPQKEMKGTVTEDQDPSVFEPDPFTLVVADGSFPQMSNLPHSAATGPRAPSLAAHVTAQLTATVSQTENGATEIRLDPEELGRVRLVMQSHETNMTVIVQAERPETAVLLRRHIDQLVQDVRALGYENVTIDFGGHGQRNQDRGGSDFQHVQQSDLPSGGVNTTTSEIQDTRRTRSRAIGAAGLDMRL